MTETEIRQKVVATAKKYVGCKESDGSHRRFVDAFTHTIRIIRIGSNTDNYLHPKNTLCIDYAAGTLIANG